MQLRPDVHNGCVGGQTTSRGRSSTNEAASPGGVSIRRAAEIVGVQAATIRSWERRHGLAVPPSTPGGHRRYHEADLQRLALMREEIIRGRSPADAVAAAHRVVDQHPATRDLVDAMVDAAQRLDQRGVRSALDHAAGTLGLGPAIDDVLMTGMRLLGLLWRTGRCDVAEEHLATGVARAWLAERARDGGPPVHRRPVVLACGPTTQHTLGLESLGVLLTLRGWPCVSLGAETPTRSLVRATTTSHAAAVVVVAHMAVNRRAAVASLQAVSETSAEVFYAGHAFTRASSRRSVPGTYLPESIAEANRVVDARLTGDAHQVAEG